MAVMWRMAAMALCALFSFIGAALVMVPQIPQLRRQFSAIHLAVVDAVHCPFCTSSLQRALMSKHECVCPAGSAPFSDASGRPVIFSHSVSSRVRVGLTPISAFICRARSFIAANFAPIPSSCASAPLGAASSSTSRPQRPQADIAARMPGPRPPHLKGAPPTQRAPIATAFIVRRLVGALKCASADACPVRGRPGAPPGS
jgi:hypothetical protein